MDSRNFTISSGADPRIPGVAPDQTTTNNLRVVEKKQLRPWGKIQKPGSGSGYDPYLHGARSVSEQNSQQTDQTDGFLNGQQVGSQTVQKNQTGFSSPNGHSQ